LTASGAPTKDRMATHDFGALPCSTVARQSPTLFQASASCCAASCRLNVLEYRTAPCAGVESSDPRSPLLGSVTRVRLTCHCSEAFLRIASSCLTARRPNSGWLMTLVPLRTAAGGVIATVAGRLLTLLAAR
jgi:hypothetical protein